MKRPVLVAAAFVAVSLVWGSTYLGIRVALESLPPFAIGAARFLVAGAVLLTVALARGEPWPGRVQWRAAAVTGTLLFVVGNGLVNVAETRVSSGLASVLVATMPLWATLVSRIAGERVSRGEAMGIALGLLGVAVMNLGGELRASPGGAVCGLLAPMGWALGSVASRRMALPEGVVMRTGMQMLAGGAAMALVSMGLGEHIAPPTARSLIALSYLCVFGSLLGFSAYSYLLAHARTSVATSYAYVNPVIAVALGLALGGERLDGASAFGAAIVLSAVLLVALNRSRKGVEGAAAAIGRARRAREPAEGGARSLGCVVEGDGR
jgi:drug/metabolite transporter (DMT)-like permease